LNFKLRARINRSDTGTIRQALDQLAAKSSVRKEGDEFLVEAEMEGASAKVRARDRQAGKFSEWSTETNCESNIEVRNAARS
jgi:hypothetical protein